MNPKNKKLITLLKIYDKLNEKNKLEVLEYARKIAANKPAQRPQTHK